MTISKHKVKFGLFEKGTKLKKIFHLIFDVAHFQWKIFSNFVPFSKSPNFKKGGRRGTELCPSVSKKDMVLKNAEYFLRSRSQDIRNVI